MKLIRLVDSLISICFRVVSLIIILLGVYFTLDSLYVYHNAMDDGLLRYRPTTDKSSSSPLRELSKDVVGWLQLYDTNVDFPIMQGYSNDEYLNKDPYGNFSVTGSIFLDYRNTKDFSDSYNTLYGHHMSSGLMFGALDKYMDSDYLNSHKEGIITTVDDIKYDLEVFACCDIQANVGEVFNNMDADALRSYLIENNLVSNVEKGRNIISFTTCKTPDSIDRTCVFAYIDRVDE